MNNIVSLQKSSLFTLFQYFPQYSLFILCNFHYTLSLYFHTQFFSLYFLNQLSCYSFLVHVLLVLIHYTFSFYFLSPPLSYCNVLYFLNQLSLVLYVPHYIFSLYFFSFLSLLSIFSIYFSQLLYQCNVCL